MDENVELEICGNCKKEIPHYNYVMHTAHCARNITLCPVCKESVPKSQLERHQRTHRRNPSSSGDPKATSTAAEDSSSWIASGGPDAPTPRSSPARLGGATVSGAGAKPKRKAQEEPKRPKPELARPNGNSRSSNGSEGVRTLGAGRPAAPRCAVGPSPREAFVTPKLLACRYCELELPKHEIGEHEDYCGSRTERCETCGELVMLRYRALHDDSNHSFLKLPDEPGPRASWEPSRPAATRAPRPEPIFTVNSFDFTPLYRSYANDYGPPADERHESYRDMSRRLDCKTEYIKNLLQDSASITVPLRRSGNAPRNHFNHAKGPAPQPPEPPTATSAARGRPIRGRRPALPPASLEIPCEFCDAPIPADDLVRHETGCRPDLARLSVRAAAVARAAAEGRAARDALYSRPDRPRRRADADAEAERPMVRGPGAEDHCPLDVVATTDDSDELRRDWDRYVGLVRAKVDEQQQQGRRGRSASEEEVELPCEFCSDMFPASQLLSHQLRCN